MSSQGDVSTSLLQAIGTDLLRSFVSVVVETWAVVIYTMLVVKASMILLEKHRRRNKMSMATLAIVIVMYLVNFSLWIIDMHNLIGEVDATLISNNPDSLEQRYGRFGDKASRLAIVEDVLYSYMTTLGDAIVLWRVYAFWSCENEQYVLIIPFAAYLGSITLSGLVTYCAAQSDADISLGAFSHPAFCQNVQFSSYWAQLATAVVATALIGYKTWKYRQLVRSYLSNSDAHKSPVNGAMIIIFDTGIIYTLYFVAEVILMFPALKRAVSASPSLSFALEIYQFTTSSIVGMYPTIIVILVHTHCTLVDSYGNTTMSTLEFQHSRVRPMQFASARSAGWPDDFPSAPEVRYRGQLAEIGLRELDLVESRSPAERIQFGQDAKETDSCDV